MAGDIEALIRELGRPAAYRHPAGDRRVHQTHISVVFLAGPFAYKVKKPLDLGFLDFTTLERRHRFCREEVRLNRRLAADVYLGVVPITREGEGLRFGGDGPVVEWAVKMRRLPANATLLDRLGRPDGLASEVLERVAVHIARFHDRAAAGPHVDRFAGWEVVAANARENLEAAGRQVGTALRAPVLERLRDGLEGELERLRPLVESRARGGRAREGHGDLHLDHVYHLPERTPPRDLRIIDCVEFDPAYRCADPVSDMAFLSMDLLRHGRADLDASYREAYFAERADPEGPELLALYRSYRAAVRGKVEGMTAVEPEVGEEERRAALERARGHWLFALSELETPDRRPGLVVLGGLPGTGKSTLAAGLRRIGGFEWIDSDRVRKALAGVAPEEPRDDPHGEGIYTPGWTDRTYAELLDQARERLFGGGRVLIEASFGRDERRERFLRAAIELGVRTAWLECRAPAETARARLRTRTGGPSDAGPEVYTRMAGRWDTPGPRSGRHLGVVPTEGPPEEALEEARRHLRRAGLLGAAA